MWEHATPVRRSTNQACQGFEGGPETRPGSGACGGERPSSRNPSQNHQNIGMCACEPVARAGKLGRPSSKACRTTCGQGKNGRSCRGKQQHHGYAAVHAQFIDLLQTFFAEPQHIPMLIDLRRRHEQGPSHRAEPGHPRYWALRACTLLESKQAQFAAALSP
jgi:hypothetical protein